ncbi:MAG: hypothetical protein MJA84_16675 [Firmicutes bacterium]|nr:hypothetical protein [Bacillota bacterium]
MENARALDEKLRRIIKEVSDDTGSEIKRDLLHELVSAMDESQSRELRKFLHSFNQALKKI